MNASNIVGSLAVAVLITLTFVPGGAAAGIEMMDDECSGIIDSSCMHCHADGVCLSCNNGYINLGTPQVNHISNNHCWHG